MENERISQYYENKKSSNDDKQTYNRKLKLKNFEVKSKEEILKSRNKTIEDIERFIDQIPKTQKKTSLKTNYNKKKKTNQYHNYDYTKSIDADMEYQLLKMIYSDEIMDVKTVTNKLGIPMDELESLVNKLIKHGLVKYISEYEAKITEEGLYYIQSKEKYHK